MTRHWEKRWAIFPTRRCRGIGAATSRSPRIATGCSAPLEGIRLNDDVRIVTSRGEYHYRVTKTHIVDPDDVWVIAPTVDADDHADYVLSVFLRRQCSAAIHRAGRTHRAHRGIGAHRLCRRVTVLRVAFRDKTAPL